MVRSFPVRSFLVRALQGAVAALFFAAAVGAQTPLASPAPSSPVIGADAANLQTRDALHAPGSDVTVFLLTVGNGAQVWELFGHAAIWIHDNRTMRDSVFNWGEFDMRAPHFILHFVQGLMLYQMGGQSLADVLYADRYFNRTVWSQELTLSAAQKDTLLAIIRENSRPENVQYRYDYFVDNCATRPRDILDRVLGGQLRVGADSVTTHSYRWHTLRLMQGNLPLALGVDIGLGRPSDRPVTRWQEMFLPRELHDWVATREVRDSTGALVPLVREERVLYQSTRPPEATQPPSYGWLWLVGIVLAAAFAALGMRARRGATAHAVRTTAAVLLGLWSLASGVLGVLLVILWAGTDHRFAYSNENLLLFNPLWLALAALLPMFIWRGRLPRTTRVLVYTVAGLAVVAGLAHVVGVSRQHNIPLIGLALPPALAIAGLFVDRRRPAGSRGV
jgi:hypothetical protein